jgi:hypothetical protein
MRVKGNPLYSVILSTFTSDCPGIDSDILQWEIGETPPTATDVSASVRLKCKCGSSLNVRDQLYDPHKLGI